MSTINISLPQEQVLLIDDYVKKYNFANRSEFIRSIIRILIHKPEIVSVSSTFPFHSPEIKSTEKIISAFKQTKKYSPTFIRDLKQGLKNSDYFND